MSSLTDAVGLTTPDTASELKNFKGTPFKTPGFGSDFNKDNTFELVRKQGTIDSLSGLSNAFRTGADELNALKPLVEPGFGRLTEAGIRSIRDARRSSLGDLRQNLARRRVRGSSFGADDINRTNAEFAKRENEFASQAFIQELALSEDLVNQSTALRANQFKTYVDQANLELGLAAQITSGVTSVLAGNAQLIGTLNAGAADRLGNVLGTGLGAYTAFQTQGINNAD